MMAMSSREVRVWSRIEIVPTVWNEHGTLDPENLFGRTPGPEHALAFLCYSYSPWLQQKSPHP